MGLSWKQPWLIASLLALSLVGGCYRGPVAPASNPVVVTPPPPPPPPPQDSPCYDGRGRCMPGMVAVARDGQVFFTAENIVYKLGPERELIRVAGDGRLGFSGDGGPAVDAQIAIPGPHHGAYFETSAAYGALAFDAEDRLYIADTMSGRVRRIESDGTIRTVQGSAALGSYFDGPLGIAIGSDQSLYVAGVSGLKRFAPDGAMSVRSIWTFMQGIAIDPADNVYVTVAGPGCRVGIVGPNRAEACAYPAGGVQLVAPYSIAVDSSGNYLIADPFAHCILKVEPGATESKRFAGLCGTRGGYSGDGGLAVDAAFNTPHGVAVDSRGNVYIADTANARIRMVDPNGVVTTVALVPTR